MAPQIAHAGGVLDQRHAGRARGAGDLRAFPRREAGMADDPADRPRAVPQGLQGRPHADGVGHVGSASSAAGRAKGARIPASAASRASAGSHARASAPR